MDTFFKKADSILKTDVRYLSSGGFWLLVSRSNFIASGLLLSVAFANLISPESYGTYQFILSLVGITGAFSLSGINSVVTQLSARNIPGTLRWGVVTRMKWGLISIVLAGCVAVYYFVNGNVLIGTGILIAGSLTPLIESFKLYDNYLVGKEAFRVSALHGLPRRLIPITTLIVALFLTDSVLVLLSIYFVTNALMTFWVFSSIAKKYGEEDQVFQDTDAFSYSRDLSLMNIIGTISVHIDKVLLFHFLGAAPVAVYTFAQMIPKQLQGLTMLVNTLAFPKLSAQKMSVLKNTLPTKVGVFFIGVLITVIFFILVAPTLFNVLFPQYTDAILLSQVLSLSLLVIPASLLKQALVAHSKKKSLYIINLLTPVTKILLLIILLPTLGIWGAVVAALAAHVVSAITTSIAFLTTS